MREADCSTDLCIYKKGIKAVLLLLLGAGILFAVRESFLGAGRLWQAEEFVSIRLEGKGKRAGEFPAGQSGEEGDIQEGTEYMAWGVEEGAGIRTEGSEKTAEGEVLCLLGNSGLLFPEGPFLDSGDREGCLIGAGLAQALFGGTQVKGLKVKFQDRTYQVRGVIRKPVFWLVVRAGEDQMLDRVNVRVTEEKTLQQTEQEIMGKSEISGEELEWRLLLWWLEAGNLLLVTGLSAGLGSVLKRRRGSLTLWPLLLLFLLWLWFAGRSISVPGELLPDRWSDFDFWIRLWEEKRQAVLTLLAAKKRGPELEMVLVFLKTVRMQTAAGAGIILLTGLLNKHTHPGKSNFPPRSRQWEKSVL